MTVRILVGDVREKLRELPPDHFDCVVTSPPYWGLRDYGVEGQIGLERTLGEHLDVMVEVFREVRRVMKPTASLWVNYGDCYATTPNGRSAADTKAAGNDDRTFRDKPFSTVGPIFDPLAEDRQRSRGARNRRTTGSPSPGNIRAGGYLKPKDLCMIPNRLAIALQDDGWWVRSEIVWGKPNAMPDSSGKYRPSTAHEKVFLFARSPRMHYDHAAVAMPVSGNAHSRIPRGRDTYGRHTLSDEVPSAERRPGVTPKSASEGSNIRAKASFHASTTEMLDTRYLRNFEPAPVATWTIPSQAFGGAHFATFPPELVERCIRAGCPVGGEVLDPFGGAGTTGMVADGLGFDCTLIELNPAYADMAKDRFVQAAGAMFSTVELA